MGIQTSLDAVAQSDRLIDAMRLADDLAFEASRDGGTRTIRVLSNALGTDDSVVSIAATHALGQVFDEQTDIVLSGLLSDDRRFLREHAAWVLGSRLPRYDTIGRLIALVADGGFSGMLAQRTLEQWSSGASAHVAIGLEGALLGIREPDRRARVAETLGLVRHPMAALPLIRIAQDPAEDEGVRVAAIAALGQRTGDLEIADLLDTLATGDGMLADVARLALVDLWAGVDARDPRSGLTVAQLFLHADIDALLTQAGSGDNGGIATLLVRLGDALVAPRDESAGVERVITMSRGSAAEALDSIVDVAAAPSGHFYGRVPLLTEAVASADAWPLRVAARRGIRRILRAAGGVDMLHLRMADVGSLAAADVARELDIPVVFTVAPDPHVVIQSMDLSGALTRANFGKVDETDHFWFRGRLVQRLAGNAAHTVLFPRHNLQRDMSQLLGIDITAHPERHSIVPEGIDLVVVDQAVAEAAELAAGLPSTPPLAQLAALLEQLPAERRGLPLFVSVGRFHRVKGMAAIVDAWAGSELADRANLLLIGGSLATPSSDEREQLDAIDRIIPSGARLAHGLLLPGHQPNDVVARWVAAARFGVPGLAAPRGVYVCGSVKEEFGIALLEAMASGLVVVAPDGGGPATYVVQGDTGFLTRTWDVAALRGAMGEALAAASLETTDERAIRSRMTVADSFTIQAMANTLAEVYEAVHVEENQLRRGPGGIPVTLLVISPDYASHLLPLATLATAWRDRGERVVVATGEATASIVASFGFERVELRLGRGSNPGTIRAEEQPEEEDDSLRGFFDATRRGMVPTLAYQAQERLTDLMWQPVETARAVQEVVRAVGADAILVDHLAFSARLALDAARVPYADVVLGHPSALPVGDELYGFPPEWPDAFTPDEGEIAELRALCARVGDNFTREWNSALAELDPLASPSADAFAGHGPLLLYNYPQELADPDRDKLLPPHVFLGSAVRGEARDAEVDAWLASVSEIPFVYVSFGSFLSVRGDVLARVCAAIQAAGLRAAVALGSADRGELGELPSDWLVREFLPQVTLLERATLAVTHGGNNSVTEAVTAGVPMLVLPFSTDQFAGARAVQRAGVGDALDPNAATVEQLEAAIRRILAADIRPSELLAASLQATPGRERAFAALSSSIS